MCVCNPRLFHLDSSNKEINSSNYCFYGNLKICLHINLKSVMMKKIFLISGLLILSVFGSSVYPQTDVPPDIKNYVDASNIIIDRMDSIKATVDSVRAEMLLVTQNTESEKLFGSDIDWYNFAFAFLAFIVACFSAVYDFRGFRESKRTADNVTRVSLEVQMAQFDDLIRHLYRNLVCTIAFTNKILERKSHVEYPSEEHLMKLKVLPEDVLHLEKYNDNNNIYKMMHELKLLLRNYDVEIDTAMMHLKDGKISVEVLRNDLDTLAFKPLYLTKRILEITCQMTDLKGRDKSASPFKNAASIIVREHISKLKENRGPLDMRRYLDLNFAVGDAEIERPYDGLRRSRARLIDAAKGTNMLSYDDMYKDSGTYHEYCDMLEMLCEQDEAFVPFRDNITLGEFEFNKYLLTMLSIDATVEYKKIHMIKIL